MAETQTPRPYKRIATEEAFCPPDMLTRYKRLIDEGGVDDVGFSSMWGFYLTSDSARSRHIRDCLSDVDERRLQHMDAAGVDVAILALTSPGVQIMPRAEATAFSTYANDWLADAISRHPDRYAGLAACAPQDPAQAAKEIERGVGKLGLNGVILNSHTQGEYLDDPKFWPIFEAAEAMGAPVYLHPNSPNNAMISPLLDKGLDGAIYGFSVETGMHVLRLIIAGVFDRFPKLQLVVGHVGESLPFTLYRIDYMHQASVASGRYSSMKPLERRPSDYMRENLHYTNSGVAWAPPIRFLQDVIGEDRVMYAMDYPYQYNVEEVAALDAMPMADAAKAAFFEGNARRLFRLSDRL
ncbi:amidohydrolase [Brevundimonas sp. S30B]|uniref:amidohydrolase family protein n=1 Tax=unclassified Brevundimonas TaxID=2622653 RepID=UPI0010716DFC|nr:MULTISPECIES: amidohydrolase family protein [unclassified Brevundimonas]QBX36674.1 amidohydrolase [Brevundimonas sp. MF30-B]TFW04531.1 amidohydrolase [Brevundimonas sp. S30B]